MNAEERRQLSAKQFEQKAKKVHGNKYDYSLVDYKNAKTKVKIVCPKHGVFEQTPNNHLRGRSCPICSNRDKKDTKWFINKAKEIHSDKYDYSLSNYKNAKTKVKIICPEHGEFEQTPDAHLRGQGCPFCGIKTNTKNKIEKSKKIFFQKAKKIYPNFDYFHVNYLGLDTKVKIVCDKGHSFNQTPYHHMYRFQGCPICNASSGEQIIINWLNNNGYKEKFEFQKVFEDCKDKKPLPFDFFIPSKNLLIEYQGEQHYKQVSKFGGRKDFLLRKHHDWLKRRYAKSNRINLLTIPYWNVNMLSSILEEEINGV